MAKAGGRSESSVEARRVLALLDTTNPQYPIRISCMAAALREARNLTVRDPVDGELVTQGHEGTWAGALVYLVFAEQLGECFHPLGMTPTPKTPNAAHTLRWFGNVEFEDARLLNKLRNRLAHDYTLVDRPGAPSTTRFMLADDRFSPRMPPRLLYRPHGEAAAATRNDIVIVFLPALADKIERVANEVRTAAIENRLACHHPGGISGIDDRFWMRITGPS